MAEKGSGAHSPFQPQPQIFNSEMREPPLLQLFVGGQHVGCVGVCAGF